MPTELVISRVASRTWVALREHGRFAEIHVDDGDGRPGLNDLSKGRVSKVVPGIEAAFVDIGLERDAFLPAAELPPRVTTEPVSALAPPAPGRSIAARLTEGAEVLVQVEREPLGSKGARVTGRVNLVGRYLVHQPQVADRAVSRRIIDPVERDRLQTVADELPGPGGFVIRTAGEGQPSSVFRDEAMKLGTSWSEIEAQARSLRAPAVVYRDIRLPLRVIRDSSWENLRRIDVDDTEVHRQLIDYLNGFDPRMAARVRRDEGPTPLFKTAGIEAELTKALRPRVWLRSGGYLIIEETEALVSIDVNSGKLIGAPTPHDTVLRTNLEAAEEIARQIRLRDLGGTIVVDLIDMTDAQTRRQVREALGRALRADRSRTRIVSPPDQELVQIARRRSRPSLRGVLTSPCPHCTGRGRIPTFESAPGIDPV